MIGTAYQDDSTAQLSSTSAIPSVSNAQVDLSIQVPLQQVKACFKTLTDHVDKKFEAMQKQLGSVETALKDLSEEMKKNSSQSFTIKGSTYEMAVTKVLTIIKDEKYKFDEALRFFKSRLTDARTDERRKCLGKHPFPRCKFMATKELAKSIIQSMGGLDDVNDVEAYCQNLALFVMFSSLYCLCLISIPCSGNSYAIAVVRISKSALPQKKNCMALQMVRCESQSMSPTQLEANRRKKELEMAEERKKKQSMNVKANRKNIESLDSTPRGNDLFLGLALEVATLVDKEDRAKVETEKEVGEMEKRKEGGAGEIEKGECVIEKRKSRMEILGNSGKEEVAAGIINTLMEREGSSVEVRVGEDRGGKVREIEDNRVNPNLAEKLHSTETTLDPASGDVNSSREGDVDRGQTQEHRNTETERERCRDEGRLVEVEERTIPVNRVERIVVEVEERGVTANRAEKERKSGSSPPPKDELGSTEELLKELADTSFINQIASHHWTFLDSCIANKVYPLGMKAFVPCAVYKANDDLRKQWKVILNNTALELVEVCRKHYEKLINSSTDKINQLYVKGEQLRSEEDRGKFQRKRATIEEEVKRSKNEMSKSRRKKLQNTIRKHKEGRVFVENCLVEKDRHQVENETEVRQRSEKERDSVSKRPETPVVRNITAAPQSTKTTSSEDKDTRKRVESPIWGTLHITEVG
eukprot:Em0008g251a